MTETIYAFAGMPGAGKSTAAHIGMAATHGDYIEVGEIIRGEARSQGNTDPTSEELGQFAAQMREEHGNGFAMVPVIHRIQDWDMDWPAFVDSVRHIEGYNKLTELDIDTYLIWVEAENMDQRLERIQRRGRDDEANFTPTDMMDRDQREIEELGVGSILDNMNRVDFRIQNHWSRDELQEQVIGIIKETYNGEWHA